MVMAFARPLLDPSMARLVDADPQSAVILLDESMSMRYGNTYKRALDEAVGIIDRLGGGDEVALVSFDDSASLVRELNRDTAALREIIVGLEEPGFGSTRYYPALRLADQLLETARYDNRVIYLITDFRESGLQDGEAGWKLSPGVVFTAVDVGDAKLSNLVLSDVRYPEQLLEASAQQQILARIRSTGSLYLERGEVSLSINGEQVERLSVDLGERSEEVVSFTNSFDGAGSYVGEVRVTGDEFADDNAFYFTVDVLPKIQVLVVNGEASENWFDDEGHWFGLAVGGPEATPFSLQSVETAELGIAELMQSDVVVLLNVGDLSNSQAEAIADYVFAGGSLLLAPGDRVEPGLFNSQFEELTPALLQQEQANRDDYLVIADYDRRHPVLQPLEGDWTARFEGHWTLLPQADAEVLMQFDNAEPALVEKAHGEGRVMLFASSLDLEWNNLALQGLFLPFVHETLRHLVKTEFGQGAYRVGDIINLDSSFASSELVVTDSMGRNVPLTSSTSLVATKPGIYRVSGEAGSRNYAVNILPEEAEMSKIAAVTLYDEVINPETSPIQSRKVRTTMLMEELEQPQRLWWYLLALVMLLLLAEAVIANRTYR
ncbi:MAG: VWA domain-containing protein [Gammaproteobacteria bacterium]|nr:VWA domain-containing protein [Gammaproteobacteria bacterium]